jgi:hypothetical protein
VALVQKTLDSRFRGNDDIVVFARKSGRRSGAGKPLRFIIPSFGWVSFALDIGGTPAHT